MADKLNLIPITEWGFFTLPRPMVIAGPCAAESEAQVMETAKGLASFGIHVFRAGIWKPRTHPEVSRASACPASNGSRK